MQNPTRKVFDCIVDDTALISGVKKNTRDGIRKWIASGSMRLFIPLQTLEQLNRLKTGTERLNSDARETLKWLDEITSTPGAAVHLQEPDQAYETWAEVENFLLPETLLSMDNVEYEEDDSIHEDFEQPTPLDGMHEDDDKTSLSSSQSLEQQPRTPSTPRSVYSATSPPVTTANPVSQKAPAQATTSSTRKGSDSAQPTNGTSRGTPTVLRPLFNHTIWLIQQEENSEAALASYILLTNDPVKQSIAQKFGVKTKRLEQLREIIAREDREYRNRMTFMKKKSREMYTPPVSEAVRNSPVTKAATPVEPLHHAPVSDDDEDEDDVVVFAGKRNSQGSLRAPSSPAQKIFDPNEFARTPPQAPRGGRSGRGAPRTNGRGGYHSSSLERNSPRPAAHNPAQPIDPDSYARPPPAGRSIRGGRGRLWEPT